MEKNTIERTIEMTNEENTKSGTQKMVIEIASKQASRDFIKTCEKEVAYIAEEEVQYAIARLKAILRDKYLKANEEILVSLTVSVRTEQ